MRSGRVATLLVLLWALVASACKTPAGGACSSTEQCREGYECLDDAHGGLRCMVACEASTRLCADGAVCLADPSGRRVCWFGGRTGIRTACTGALECEPGTVCAAGICRQACGLAAAGEDAGAFPCDVNEECAPLESATDGTCRPLAPIGTDAGAG